MHNVRGVLDVLGLIYAAAVDSRCWDQALRALSDRLHATGVAWAKYDCKQKTGKIIQCIGCDPEYVRIYSDLYARLDPWFRSSEACEPGLVKLSKDIICDEDLVNTSFYKKWLKPQGFLHRICATVKQDMNEVYYIAAVRPRARGSFDEGDRQFLRELIPHLERALVGNGRLWKLAVSLDVLDCVPFGIVIVDKRRRPLIVNRVAKELLNEGEGLCIDSNKLSSVRADINMRLDKLIAEAAVTNGNGVSKGGAIMIPRSRQPALWAIVTPLGRRLRKVVGQKDEVAQVFLKGPEQMCQLTGDALQAYYGLTPAEQRLTRLIMQGYRPEAAARELKISQNTVRTHLKQIYAKTETGRQADLVRLLLTGPAAHHYLLE